MGVLGINHIAFRSHDPQALRAFYLDLTGGEALEAEHHPIRLGHTLLVFLESERRYEDSDPDELAFDVDADGFQAVLDRARSMDVLARGPVDGAWRETTPDVTQLATPVSGRSTARCSSPRRS